jgi:hypothetical protein
MANISVTSGAPWRHISGLKEERKIRSFTATAISAKALLQIGQQCRHLLQVSEILSE